MRFENQLFSSKGINFQHNLTKDLYQRIVRDVQTNFLAEFFPLGSKDRKRMHFSSGTCVEIDHHPSIWKNFVCSLNQMEQMAGRFVDVLSDYWMSFLEIKWRGLLAENSWSSCVGNLRPWFTKILHLHVVEHQILGYLWEEMIVLPMNLWEGWIANSFHCPSEKIENPVNYNWIRMALLC